MNSRYLITLVIIVSFLLGCEETYEVPSIEGWIVDAETNKPIKGAIVVVERPIQGGYHGGNIGYLDYQETETDKDGRFYLSELGVKKIDGYIDTSSPYIHIFKEKYQYAILINMKKTDRIATVTDKRYKRLQPSVWNNEIIKIKKFEGTNEDYKNELINISNVFNKIDKSKSNKCNWVGLSLPKFYRHLNTESEKYSDFINIDIMRMYKQTQICDEWENFFKEYRK